MFGQLRRAQGGGSVILVSYADTEAGHAGYVYQAMNFLYTGVSVHGSFELQDGSTRSVRTRVIPDSARRVGGAPKHRYVLFLAGRLERKALARALRWPVLPYPKGSGD